MELAPLQQAAEVINRSNNVLVALPERPASDAIASGLALFLVLERLGKRTKVVCSEFELPATHAFLPKSHAIERELKNLRQFIISLDVSKANVEEVGYEIDGSKLNFFVTPKNGFYESRDVTTNSGNFAFDAIVTIGAADVEALGALSRDNAEFFYSVPIVNVDHAAKNARFGQVNLVDITAASNAEIVFELIRTLGVNILDDEVSTSLLTGIIAKTKSFQSPTVTPRSLATASHLIAAGAKREEIVERLYQSKSIASLKLWGRALARLQSESDSRIVWSVLGTQDFVKSGATDDDLPGVIEELIVNIPTAEVACLISEHDGRIGAIIASTKGHELITHFSGSTLLGSDGLVRWTPSSSDLNTAEQEVLSKARALLG